MNFDGIEKIAAAILYEGYILYPYRKTALKNRQRWNFGTLYPCIYAQHQRPEEPYGLVAEVLVVGEPDAYLDFKFSFLQLVRQSDDDGHTLSDPSLAWESAVERSHEHEGLKLRDLLAGPLELNLHLEGVALPEGRCETTSPDLNARLNIRAECLADSSCKLRFELQNTSLLPNGVDARRSEALSESFVSAHVVMGINEGEFVSLLDPPAKYGASVAKCKSVGVFPVLVGDEAYRSRILCSPIILYDYPRIAPESEGDYFDGTEMDEMLTLRVLTLTDDEKEEMRRGDPRARRILERTEALTEEAMLKAHGVVRSRREIHEDLT